MWIGLYGMSPIFASGARRSFENEAAVGQSDSLTFLPSRLTM